MIDSELQKVYVKLKERTAKYQRYALPIRIIRRWALWIFLLIIIIGSIIGSFLNLSPQLAMLYTYTPLLVWFVFVGVSLQILEKKERMYRLDADDRVMFHACSILENLDNYFDVDKSELRKEYKKDIIRHANQLLSTIESNWTVGEFGLGKQVLGGSISKFKKNLRDRLVPHIEKGDETSLKTVGQIMYNFAQFLRFPSIENLDHLNTSISTNIGSYPSAKIGFFGKCSNFLKIHKALRHALVMGGIIILSCFVYFLGISYVSLEAAYISAVSLFGILLVGYWQYIKKE